MKDQPAQLHLLSPLVPYPPRAGATVHIVNAVRELARAYRVQLSILAANPAAVEWGPLSEWCESTTAFRPSRRRGRRLDPPAVHHEYSADLVAYLERAWSERAPELVQLEFTSMAQYAPLAQRHGAFVICTAHNVAFLAQIRRARQQRGIKFRARRWLGVLSLWLYELRALRQCHLIIALGQADLDVLRRWLPQTPAAFVPSGIDLQHWPVCFQQQTSEQVLFVGNYLHPPNVDGALWLARDIWPRVRQARSTARLTLAGRAPTPQVESLAAPDISVPGTVPDMHALYERADVVVAPITWGSGIRIKILEAMACGLPVVTTALAAENIGLVDGESALFAETPQDFATAVVRLLEDPALRQRIGAAGRSIVERNYDWRAIGRRLVELYEQGRSRL